jgi:hypothetical protein
MREDGKGLIHGSHICKLSKEIQKILQGSRTPSESIAMSFRQLSLNSQNEFTQYYSSYTSHCMMDIGGLVSLLKEVLLHLKVQLESRNLIKR